MQAQRFIAMSSLKHVLGAEKIDTHPLPHSQGPVMMKRYRRILLETISRYLKMASSLRFRTSKIPL
jgi:hypothetical protein